MDSYPNQLISTHLSIALSDYSNFDGISDKEFYFILEKYRCEKELDTTPLTSDKEIEELYKGFELTTDELEEYD
jgi:hypothetical protein